MRSRITKWRAPEGHNAALGTALALALLLGSLASQAGIFRDVMVTMHLSKPDAPAGAPQGVPWDGFACCNLHYDGDTITDRNYSELPMIPPGTPIQVIAYNDGKQRADIKVDGKSMKLSHDNGREQESLEAWVGKIVVRDDPRPRLRSYPMPVRDAIYQGKVMVGMTREQAIASIGYPVANENIVLDTPIWRLYRGRHDRYELNFRTDGRVNSITGETEVTSQVLYQP
ncbi:MAG: hypothetical protein ABSF96_12415 [Steroidobacteraceae bacterium]